MPLLVVLITMIKKITNMKEFDNELQQNEIVVVDFWATWCGPCRIMNPIIKDFADENEQVTVLKVDVDEAPEISQRYNIMSIPTMIFFKNGEPEGKKIVGVVEKFILKENLKTVEQLS